MQYPPTVEHAFDLAEVCVSAVFKLEEVTLDYSVESLIFLDSLVGDWHDQGAPLEECASVLFTFGCYVGEVFVKNAGGVWVDKEAVGMEMLAMSPIVVQLPNGAVCNPIDKVFKRLENGDEDYLPFFYQVFTVPPEEMTNPN